jgi:hypothetical protein
VEKGGESGTAKGGGVVQVVTCSGVDESAGCHVCSG